uniref:Mytilin 3 n=1 Tax=Perna canaliculus TaxID=38949 RepID=A0A6B9XQI8_PERCI|nr:mytilin 3 [Perna canaliculus]
MKALIALSVILIVVVIGMTEVNASCATSCSSRCEYRKCEDYASAIRDGKCYCCCIKCRSDSFFSIGHVNEMTPREDFNEQLMLEIKDHQH